MIRLLLDPPRFECESARDAAELARLMDIGAVPAKPMATPPLAPRATRHSIALAPVAAPAASHVPCKLPAAKPIKPTGHTKTCKTCGKKFPVLDRSDCPSVYCRTCLPVLSPRKNPKAPVPAAGRPGAAQRHADPIACVTCGASVPEFESINGQCLQCAPLAARKRAS